MDWKQAITWGIMLAPTAWAVYTSRQDRKYKPRH